MPGVPDAGAAGSLTVRALLAAALVLTGGCGQRPADPARRDATATAALPDREPDAAAPVAGPTPPMAPGAVPRLILDRFDALPASTALMFRARLDLLSRRLPAVKRPVSQMMIAALGFLVSSTSPVDLRRADQIEAWGLQPDGHAWVSLYGDLAAWTRSARAFKKIFSDPSQSTLPMRVLLAKVPSAVVGFRAVVPVAHPDRLLARIRALLGVAPGQAGGFVPGYGVGADDFAALRELRPTFALSGDSNRLTVGWLHGQRLLVEMLFFARRMPARSELAGRVQQFLSTYPAASADQGWLSALVDPTADLGLVVDGPRTGHLGHYQGVIQAIDSLGAATPWEVVQRALMGSEVAYYTVALAEEAAPLLHGFGAAVRTDGGRLTATLSWRLQPTGKAIFTRLTAALGPANLLQPEVFAPRLARPLAATLSRDVPPRGPFRLPAMGLAKYYVEAGVFAHFIAAAHAWVDLFRYPEVVTAASSKLGWFADLTGLREGFLSISEDRLTLRLR